MSWKLAKDENPEELEAIVARFQDARIPADGRILPQEAGRLMLVFQAYSDDLVTALAQARLKEERRKFEKEAGFSQRFMAAAAELSDRKREAAAKNDPAARLQEVNYFESKVYRQLLEDKLESAIRSYHAMKALAGSNQSAGWAA